MTEAFYAAVSHARFLGLTLITGFCYSYLARPFLHKRRGVWLAGGAYSAAAAALYYLPYFEISNFSAYALSVLAGFAVLCRLEWQNIEQKLFLAHTFFSLRWLVAAMETCVSKSFLAFAYGRAGTGAGWLAYWRIFAADSILCLLFSFCTMFPAVRLIQKAYVYKDEAMTKRELLLLFVSSLPGALGYAVLQSYNRIYERDSGLSIYDAGGIHNWLFFVYYAASFAAILIVIIIFQDIKRHQEEEKRGSLLSRQLEDMERHIKEVEKLYQDIRSLKHDMGNHILTLERLCGQNSYDSARDYISQLKVEMNAAAPEIRSGNPITDVILTEHKQEAEEKGIAFACSFHYPEGTRINAFDVSVILHNAIANAIAGAAGCERPYIQVVSYRTKNAYMIEISNNYTGSIIFNEASGLPETSQKDKSGHGFGLLNIRRAAQKYFGDVDIAADGQNFCLSIMLMTE